jgi:hypothetical protein
MPRSTWPCAHSLTHALTLPGVQDAVLGENTQLKKYGTAAVGAAAVIGVVVGALVARGSAAVRLRSLSGALASQRAATGEPRPSCSNQ